jgi:ATP synthase I chain
MTPGELTSRVTLDTSVAVVTLAAPSAWLAGAPGGLGVLAGGVLALGSFRWLVARASAVTAAGGAPTAAWLIGAGLRFGVCAVACAVLLASGWAHPLALIAGFTVLPCDVIARGLAAARADG